MSVKITENGPKGIQVEWNGILLTLQINAHHGLSGSLAEMSKDGKTVHMLNFHGKAPAAPFPFRFHEDEMDADPSTGGKSSVKR